ncbi:MAG TPA: energy-coupling factor transporter ATPase [Epulopiscium sp.]|nr:energy-coupling factor transporter ATPase [Candidatus Epulonipiscium sp.]
MDQMVQAKDLTFKYHKHNEQGEIEESFTALDNLSLDIKKGEFVVIVGHNGSGKSTFAKHLNAILTPMEGILLIKGIDTKDSNRIWDIRQIAGMVFQNPDNQIVATIVDEDIAFGPENLGVPPQEIRDRVDKALEAVEMTAYKNHSPNYLSGGQKQRVAIAGVLAMKPECIVFDEPTAMLDPVGRKEVLKTIHKLNKEEDITIIHITHYMQEAIHADRVIVMEEGNIVMEGTPREIFAQVGELRELGLSAPDTTTLAYELQKRGIDISTEILSVEEVVDAIWQLNLKM